MKKIVLFLSTLSLLFAQTPLSQSIKIKKIYPMGEKIYKHKCKNINPSLFHSLQEMQQTITSQHLCKKLNDKYFNALSLYLWEVKREKIQQKKLPQIVVTHKEKCPVCGMFVYKYPRWSAQIFYKNKHYSFDGVKDLMKWYFQHKKDIQYILVRDYYSQQTIDGTKAYYVIGSNVYGPMGNELIPFQNKKEAQNFLFDHAGQKIISFDKITEDMVYQLD